MRKRGLISILAVLAAITLASAQTAGTGTGASGNHAGQQKRTGQGGPSGVGHVTLPPGWGLAPPTRFGSVNHPGGVAGNTVPGLLQPMPMVLQPLPMVLQPMPSVVQPLVGIFQPGTSDTEDMKSRRGNGPHRGAVPVGIPIFIPYGGYYAPPPVEEAQAPAEVSTQGTGNGPGVWGGSVPPAVIYAAPAPASAPAPSEPASKPITLLVFTDHSIYAVTDYWVEQGRLHYVTSYGASNSVPLGQLDLEFTWKLNDERNIKFELKNN